MGCEQDVGRMKAGEGHSPAFRKREDTVVPDFPVPDGTARWPRSGRAARTEMESRESVIRETVKYSGKGCAERGKKGRERVRIVPVEVLFCRLFGRFE